MAVTNAYANQIQNRNFLSPTGFKFVLNRAPKVAFFGNTSNIPGMTLGEATQPTYLKDIPLPGDKLVFEDFNMQFLVDEELENYLEIYNWLRGLGFPESLQEIYDFQQSNADFKQPNKSTMNLYSDATLTILTSKENPNFKIMFKDMFPTSLSTLQFDATTEDINYLTASGTFKYTIYDITNLSGTKL